MRNLAILAIAAFLAMGVAPCRADDCTGLWGGTFNSNVFSGSTGTISDWILWPDGTTDGTWVLTTPTRGTFTMSYAEGTYSCVSGSFVMSCSGTAVHHTQLTSPYTLTASGTISSQIPISRRWAAVSLSASAASEAFEALFQRMAAHPSGLITE